MNQKVRRFIIIGMTLLLISISMLFSNTLGMHYYEKLDFVTGLVTASVLNVRAGPRNKLSSGNTSKEE